MKLKEKSKIGLIVLDDDDNYKQKFEIAIKMIKHGIKTT